MARNDRMMVDMGDWTKGVNSALPASFIPEGFYSWSENVINRGNVVQTRPGMRIIEPVDGDGNYLPAGRPQGFTVFQHTDLSFYMIIAISGKIYQSKHPFTSFQRIPNLQFDPEAPQIVFKATKKGADYDPVTGLQAIAPYNILMIQDGRTRAGYWDGENSGHLDPSPARNQTPIGLWMEWTGNRLWVATDHRVYASDILDPLSFTEGDYLAEADGFWFREPITGMIRSANDDALLVFTATTISALQSNIRERRQWQQTPNFQREILPSIGCVAGKSIVNYYGLTWWISADGLTNLDAAMNTYQTGRIAYKDAEMARSKSNLSPLMTGACCGTMEGMLMVSVPHADVQWNRHTWIMDSNIASLLHSAAPPCWSSVWTGIRPVEWAFYEDTGTRRVFCLSNDYHNRNNSKCHIWELFYARKEDFGHSIPCSIETRSATIDGNFHRFKYAEIDIRELYGEVSMQVYFGGNKGPWFKILDIELQAERGSPNSVIQQVFNDESVLQTFNPQVRTVRTNDVFGNSFNDEHDVCGIESDYKGFIDKSFQIRIDWQGHMGISRVRFYTEPVSESKTGKCGRQTEVGQHNIINDKGEGIDFTETEEPPGN